MKHVLSCFLLLTALSQARAQVGALNKAVRVEVVASAAEYVPLSTTVSHPGHSYTNCLGSTSYFGQFSTYGDFGSFSGTADTNTQCRTTFTLPTQTTLTTYRKVNYTIVKNDQALYLLSCTQTWKPNALTRLAAVMKSTAARQNGDNSGQIEKETLATGPGKWSECPAFDIGARYALTVLSASDARLEDAVEAAPRKPTKLEYLGSAALPVPTPGPTTQSTRVHITSSPSGGEIYIDGKFFGSTPSDITLPAGQHAIKIAGGGREWSRSIEITPGEISVHADLSDK